MLATVAVMVAEPVFRPFAVPVALTEAMAVLDEAH